MAKGLGCMTTIIQADGKLYLPSYWEDAKLELMKRDRILRKLIPQFGDLHLVGRGEPFTTLARSIVGQQISVKAADAVWRRFLELCPKCTPAQVVKAGDSLATCGLSKRKTEYILDLADHFKAKRVHADKWTEMDDERNYRNFLAERLVLSSGH